MLYKSIRIQSSSFRHWFTIPPKQWATLFFHSNTNSSVSEAGPESGTAILSFISPYQLMVSRHIRWWWIHASNTNAINYHILLLMLSVTVCDHKAIIMNVKYFLLCKKNQQKYMKNKSKKETKFPQITKTFQTGFPRIHCPKQ